MLLLFPVLLRRARIIRSLAGIEAQQHAGQVSAPEPGLDRALRATRGLQQAGHASSTLAGILSRATLGFICVYRSNNHSTASYCRSQLRISGNLQLASARTFRWSEAEHVAGSTWNPRRCRPETSRSPGAQRIMRPALGTCSRSSILGCQKQFRLLVDDILTMRLPQSRRRKVIFRLLMNSAL